MSVTLDTTWVEPFLADLLARWLRAADTPDGLFHPDLDRAWQRLEHGSRTLVSQCRLIYVFTRAWQRSGDAAYAEAVHRGIAALLRHFGTPAEGLAIACDADGRVQDDARDAYGHAFVLLALATAATAFPRDDYREGAFATWRFMKTRLTDAHGGLIPCIAPDGTVLTELRTQNPVMHTFEALLALAVLDDSGETDAELARVQQFILARTRAPGCLPEWYDADWQPLAAGERWGVDLGHAFEWAFLLSEWQARRGEAAIVPEARAFLDLGLRWGYDPQDGGVQAVADYQGQLRDAHKGWWQQCEAIRALHRFATRYDETRAWEPLHRTLAYARRTFEDPVYGGWYLAPPDRLDKGSVWKLDYHVVNMCLELLGT